MKMIHNVVLRSCALLAIASTAIAQTSTGPTNEPLLSQSNLVYEGSFRLPQGATDQTSFAYGGRGLAYNPANNSLILTGHSNYQLTAEVSIPTPVVSTNISQMPTATIIQPLSDATDGERNTVNPATGTGNAIGGYLVYGGTLIVSVFSYYDADGHQTASHFVRPLNLSTSTIAGPYRVGTDYPGWVSGYMTTVPPEWQPLLGGPALTGNCCLNIVSFQSNGPAVATFDPAKLTGSTGVPVGDTPLVGYPASNPLGTGWGTQSNLFNGTTSITGVVFPVGTRTVLFFGKQGIGPFCYGEGTSNSALAGQTTPDGGVWCFDPATSAKGGHAYPYEYQIWAYDANDLLKVKQGLEPRYAVQPYAVWQPSIPFATSELANGGFGGAAYDAANNRIFVTQECVDVGCTPLVDVFKVDGAAAPPTPPKNVEIK